MKISYKLDDKELEIIKKAQEITCIDYEVEDNLIPAGNFIGIIEDLISEIDRIQEEFDDFKHDVKDNYEPVPYEKQIGYNPYD